MLTSKYALLPYDYSPPSLCFAEGDDNPGAGEGAASGPAAEAASEAAVAEASADVVEGEVPEKKQTPWFQKRINELTAEKHEERRQREALQSELTLMQARLEQMQADGQRPSDPANPDSAPRDAGKRPLTDAEIEAMVDSRAAEKARAKEFTDACNRVAADGAKAFPDFVETRDALMGAFGDKIGARPEFIEAITALPNGHEVFYRLGKELDLASQIFGLSPAKMGVKLAEISAETAKRPPIPQHSKAPPPIRTVDGAARPGEPSLYDAGTGKITPAQFNAIREKQIADANRKKYARAS